MIRLNCRKCFCRNIALAAVVIFSGCATPLDLEGALAAAPYRIEDNGRIVIKTAVNGRGAFDFIVDTAASISAVFDDLSAQLPLETIPGQVIKVRGVVASGEFSLLDVDQLSIGTETWDKPRLVSLPSDSEATGELDGLLGLDFLARYAVFFSASEQVIRLYSPEFVARQNYRDWASVPLSVMSISKDGPAIYTMDIEIEGHAIPAVFDLGAGVNMINWKGARSIGIRRHRVDKRQIIVGAVDAMRYLARLDAREVTTARVRWRNESFAIADLDIFEALMIADRPIAILGAPFFTQRDFIIDFERNRLLIKPRQREVNRKNVAAPD